MLASPSLVVDACRNAVHAGGVTVTLATRPVVFALARTLGEAWPGDAPRAALIAAAFGSPFTDESHRARLRVEVARLRTALREVGDVRATRGGFVLMPHTVRDVMVLAPPVDDAHVAVLALLADGEAWSSSALALALGASQRTAQRALDALATGGRAQWFGRGRARRWIVSTVPGFATPLSLPAPARGD